MSIFATPIAAMFKSGLAVSARYQHGSADPIFLRVMPRNPDIAADIFQTEIRRQAAFYDCQVAELPSPAKGAQLTITGRQYRILDASHPDADRLIWVLHCEVLG